jgi:DNA-directed RNA polymerase subunit RPC12/RpoP
MDIIFNCSNCDQELAVDADGAGSEINCPTCGTSVKVPEATQENTQASSNPDEPAAPNAPQKVEKHFVVPQRSSGDSLIKKPKPTLEVAAKDQDKQVRIKTIKHSDCVEVGKDRFDDVVSELLQKIGAENIISISPISYSHTDLATRQLVQDFAVLVVFKG